MSWNNAISYCFDNGGILESNETIVQKYSVNMTNEDVWIGRYKGLTDWAGIWGKLNILYIKYVLHASVIELYF
jgi:hypothetical protein